MCTKVRETWRKNVGSTGGYEMENYGLVTMATAGSVGVVAPAYYTRVVHKMPEEGVGAEEVQQEAEPDVI